MNIVFIQIFGCYQVKFKFQLRKNAKLLYSFFFNSEEVKFKIIDVCAIKSYIKNTNFFQSGTFMRPYRNVSLKEKGTQTSSISIQYF